MHFSTCVNDTFSHKKWRALQKRLKRKRKRQTEGAARDELQQLGTGF